MSEMRKKNGLRQTKREGLGIIRLDMATTVATAASDPSSWTSRKAFWRTSLTKSESTSAKPERHSAVDFCPRLEHLSSRLKKLEASRASRLTQFKQTATLKECEKYSQQQIKASY